MAYEADHSLLYSVTAKNVCSCTSTSLCDIVTYTGTFLYFTLFQGCTNSGCQKGDMKQVPK
jgi:hypothetical protein